MKYLYFALAIVALYYLTRFILKLPAVKGALGELKVKRALRWQKYVINNLIIADERGHTSQIDHIVINSAGIFVIETKNYAGRIYGNDSQLEWTQVLNYGRIKNKLYNPVKQNATHIYKLSKIIGNDFPIFSVVVFVKGNTEFIESDDVYTIQEMKFLIKEGADKQLPDEKILEIYNKLLDLKENCKITSREHIQNIDKLQTELEEGICPRCGGELVERKGKNGSFLGCSNYPSCRFTKRID